MRGRLAGKIVELTKAERTWLRIFQRTAQQFRWLSEEESFCLSFEALASCYRKGKDQHAGYLRRACRNRHLNFARMKPIRYKRYCWHSANVAVEIKAADLLPRERIKPPIVWEDEGRDRRIDIEWAVTRLGNYCGKSEERTARMKLECYTFDVIAGELGVCQRTVRRLWERSAAHLRRWLSEYG